MMYSYALFCVVLLRVSNDDANTRVRRLCDSGRLADLEGVVLRALTCTLVAVRIAGLALAPLVALALVLALAAYALVGAGFALALALADVGLADV